MHRHTLLGLLFWITLSLTACSSQTPNPTSGPDDIVGEPAPMYHIDVVLNDPQYQDNAYVKLLKNSEVLDEIMDGDPNTWYTVLVPEAGWEEKLGVSLEAFKAQPRLKDILKYNIVKGEMPLTILHPTTYYKGQVPTLLDGETIEVEQVDTKSLPPSPMTLNESTTVLYTNVLTYSSLDANIWGVDRPVLPPGITFK